MTPLTEEQLSRLKQDFQIWLYHFMCSDMTTWTHLPSEMCDVLLEYYWGKFSERLTLNVGLSPKSPGRSLLERVQRAFGRGD